MASSNHSSVLGNFFKRGEPFVWLSGLGLSTILLMVFVVLYVISKNGIGVFWPSPLYEVTLEDQSKLLGELVREQKNYKGKEQLQLKVGNRDLGQLDFRWVNRDQVTNTQAPSDALVLEREEYGNFYGYLHSIQSPFTPASHSTITDLEAVLEEVHDQLADIDDLRSLLDGSNRSIETYGHRSKDPEDLTELALLQEKSANLQQEMERREAILAESKAHFLTASGQKQSIRLMDIVRFQQPNSMSFFEKLGYNLTKTIELFVANPRESNTEGGLFPAIFGTVMLIILMSICSFPLGVLAGIYLKEYAKDGPLLRLVRIAVNNLAGIPSIVYGIFGLGFFIYGVGASIDQAFFSDTLPEPTFGTGGLLWASLTLGLLTIPVVIVATEEALSAVPRAIRENSYALGATKFQTLYRISLPAASGGILTGFILSMARAAGEVAPLMITGVVKMAPTLALDGYFPFVHLERKFMHLGFHIYDISCQSPNVEAAKPMVYVTTMLLILIVMVLSGAAIYMREKLKRKYQLSSI